MNLLELEVVARSCCCTSCLVVPSAVEVVVAVIKVIGAFGIRCWHYRYTDIPLIVDFVVSLLPLVVNKDTVVVVDNEITTSSSVVDVAITGSPSHYGFSLCLKFFSLLIPKSALISAQQMALLGYLCYALYHIVMREMTCLGVILTHLSQ